LRELADREVCLLLAGAPFTEGYTPYLRYRSMEAWALCLASHLARYRLRRRLGQENLPPKIPRIRDLLLVIRTPLVSIPATNRVRTLRKRISSKETGIAAVRQPQDSRPVYPCRRLLCSRLGRVGLSFHFRSFLRPWQFHQCQTRFLFLVFCRLCYNYRLQRSIKQAHVRPPDGSPDQSLNGGSADDVCPGGSTGCESTLHQECGSVLVISFLGGADGGYLLFTCLWRRSLPMLEDRPLLLLDDQLSDVQPSNL